MMVAKNSATLIPGIFAEKVMLIFANFLAAKIVARGAIPPAKVANFSKIQIQKAVCSLCYSIYYIKKVYNNIKGRIYI